MVNVNSVSLLCSKRSCTTRPSFNFQGTKRAAFCKRHSRDGMVCIAHKRCVRDRCSMQAKFNIEGITEGKYCRRHARDGMVDVHTKLCSHDSCTRYPAFNIKGKTAAYCSRHAAIGMVNVRGRLCLHDGCPRQPKFDVEGTRLPAYCRQHAKEGMVNVRTIRCSHTSCTKYAAWGALVDGTRTVCGLHKGDIKDGEIICFGKRCKVAGCVKVSRWGLEGKQPTHCLDHGPLVEGFIHTLGRGRRKEVIRNSSSTVARVSSVPVKTECTF